MSNEIDVTEVVYDTLVQNGFKVWKVDSPISLVNGKTVECTVRHIPATAHGDIENMELVDHHLSDMVKYLNGRFSRNCKLNRMIVLYKGIVVNDRKGRNRMYLRCNTVNFIDNTNYDPLYTRGSGDYRDSLSVMNSLIEAGTNPEDAPVLAIKLVKELKDKSSK